MTTAVIVLAFVSGGVLGTAFGMVLMALGAVTKSSVRDMPEEPIADKRGQTAFSTRALG